jgi:zeta-carotene desaturase
MENADITSLAIEHIRRFLPQLDAHEIRRSVVVRGAPRDVSLAPGGPARPGTVTPLRGFFLAGDWTDTGLPGTIEGAVQSGHAAAAAVAS